MMEQERRTDRDLLSLCPREMNIMKFVEARVTEMETMSFLIRGSGKNTRVMQNLPIHMRRRAMSHNAKRFPKRLQLLAQDELLSQNLKPRGKRPRRYHRSRPKQRTKNAHKKHDQDSSKIWLRTHIWHAKRFKMTTMWNRCIPYKINEKCLRKTYRAVKQGSLIQDISHTCLWEMIGDQAKIVEVFKRMTNPASSDVIDDVRFIGGRQRGLASLYKLDAYPRDCLGPVSFLWMPEGATSDVSSLINVNNDQRKLWLWTHPACAPNILATIEQARDEYGYHLVEIKSNLVMFRLYGGGCTKILREVLVSATKREVNDVVVDEVAGSLETQNGSGSDVFSALVKYPTLYRKANGCKLLEDAQIRVEELPATLPEHVPLSPLFWSDEARETFNADIAEKMRGRNLKTDLDLSEELCDDAIPVLLIHIPVPVGCPRAPHGWEIILPSNAAMLVWKAFIYHQTRALGLFEWHNVCSELNFPIYPYSYPDTEAGNKFLMEQAESAKNEYERRPPGKRTNYLALCVREPFRCPWGKLTSHWSTNSGTNYFVLRDRTVLRTVKLALDTCTPSGLGDSQWALALVPVHLTTLAKGALDQNALISIPSAEDLRLRDSENKDPKEALRRSVKSMALPPSRDVIGYLYLAGYSLSQGCCFGQGFVALRGLDEMLQRNRDNRVLVRATGTLQFRFARIRVDCERPPLMF